MTYSLPIQDDDRIKLRVQAREANTIRHIVPLGNLVLLTSAAEWVLTSINTDAIAHQRERQTAELRRREQCAAGAGGLTAIYCAAAAGTWWSSATATRSGACSPTT